jgi:hypothetical protein
MAIVRCKSCGKPSGITRNYVRSVKPVGYPETAAVCGNSSCTEPGLVWLDESDSKAYEAGERVVRVPNNAVKIRVQ